MENIKFVNAQEMAKNNPSTFGAPSIEELNQLKIGDSVKVCDGSERFWVTVGNIEISKDAPFCSIITGDVDNDLFGDELSLGDEIQFKFYNVYNIF
jgi:hypothetical protein